jgi:hypothetical protein
MGKIGVDSEENGSGNGFSPVEGIWGGCFSLLGS